MAAQLFGLFLFGVFLNFFHVLLWLFLEVLQAGLAAELHFLIFIREHVRIAVAVQFLAAYRAGVLTDRLSPF